MTITQAKGIFTAAMYADDTVLITGLHGIGKSEGVAEWCKENNLHNETIFLSMFEIGDLLGIPKITETPSGPITDWAAPDWFQNIINAAFPIEFELSDLEFNDKEFEKFVNSRLK